MTQRRVEIRIRILAALRRDNTPRSAGEIARLAGSYPEMTRLVLHWMHCRGEIMRSMKRARHQRRYVWSATKRGLRLALPASAALPEGRFRPKDFDHRILSELLGIPDAPPAAPASAAVHRLDSGAGDQALGTRDQEIIA